MRGKSSWFRSRTLVAVCVAALCLPALPQPAAAGNGRAVGAIVGVGLALGLAAALASQAQANQHRYATGKSRSANKSTVRRAKKNKSSEPNVALQKPAAPVQETAAKPGRATEPRLVESEAAADRPVPLAANAKMSAPKPLPVEGVPEPVE
jgi:hypothetical protein